MARPSEYNYKMCVEICDKLANGQHIFDILEENELFPSWPTFRRWKNNNEELRTMYVNAQQDKSEACTHEIIKVKELLKNGFLEAAAANVIIQTNKWFSSKFYPKMYGDNSKQENELDNETKELDQEERRLRIIDLQNKLKNIDQ